MAVISRDVGQARTAALLMGALAMLVSGCCAFAAPQYRGPVTDHFDGRRFYNPDGRAIALSSLVSWLTHRDRGPWAPYRDVPPGPPPPRSVEGGALRVTFINHATTLIQMDGVNVLTDPVYARRVGPAGLVGPDRHRPPGVRFEDLPPIHVILLSHDHYDHMDVPTLKRLVRAFHPRIFAGLGTRALLAREGVLDVEDLDWWQAVAVSPAMRVVSVPAHHASMRGICDQCVTLWNGFVLAGTSGNVYFAGDTGWGEHFREVGERFAPLRLALLPIGSGRPREILGPNHISPEEAVWAHIALNAKTSVPMHYGTFAQGDDGETEPVTQLRDTLKRYEGLAERFWVLDEGQGREIPP